MTAATPHRTPLYRPWAVWLAVLLAVFSALAPAVSHAIARAQGSTAGIEICTPMGMRIVSAETVAQASSEAPAGPQSLVSFAHCPFCLHSADHALAAPPALQHLFLEWVGQPAISPQSLFFLVNSPAFAPPPRGPPTHS